jgi:hypothetical protein
MNDIDLTAIMERDGIEKIKRHLGGWYLVRLFDGRCGSGNSVGEALGNAKSPEAVRIAA